MLMKEFCEKSHLSSSLIRAAIKQLGGWGYFSDHFKNIRNNYSDGGEPGFTWNDDTSDFVSRNKKIILEMLEEWSGDEDFLPSMKSIEGLHRYNLTDIAKGLFQPRQNEDVSFFIACFVLYEVCRSYYDILENEGEM